MHLQAISKAISDPTRRAILQLLKNKRMSAGDIVSHFNISGASISNHLAILKDAGLVTFTREGQFIYYELRPTPLIKLSKWIDSLL